MWYEIGNQVNENQDKMKCLSELNWNCFYNMLDFFQHHKNDTLSHMDWNDSWICRSHGNKALSFSWNSNRQLSTAKVVSTVMPYSI